MSDPLDPTSVVLVRHGETKWNTEGRYQGQLDSPLTDEGVRQAEAIAARLASEGAHWLCASDLGRARTTAEVIAHATNLPLQLDPRLRERHFGVFHGLTPDAIRQQYPTEYACFRAPDADYQMPRGESLRQVHERAVACLAELAEQHRGQRLVLVSHGGVLSALLKHVLGLRLEVERPFRLLNAGYNLIRQADGRWLLEVLGDVSHLQSPAGPDDVI